MFKALSRIENGAVHIGFADEKSYKDFLEAMNSLDNVKAFVADGAMRLGAEAAKYAIKKSGYEAVFFEALREKANDFIESYESNFSGEDEIKLAFAIDVENFVKDRFFLDKESHFTTWLCHTMPDVVAMAENSDNDDNQVAYFGFNRYSKDDDGLHHVYYVYDKLKDELYVKVYSICHKVTGVQRSNIFKRKDEWTKFKRENCDNPDSYKKAVSYLFYGKDEDDFLEFYEKEERDRFAKIVSSWKNFEAFLKEIIEETGEEWAEKIYNESGSESLLFSILRRAYKHFPSYLSVDAKSSEEDDFLSRSLRVLADSLSDGDSSLFIASVEKTFNNILSKKKVKAVERGSRVVLASKKIGSKEDRYWKVYTSSNESELNHDLEMLKSMGYELAEIWC